MTPASRARVAILFLLSVGLVSLVAAILSEQNARTNRALRTAKQAQIETARLGAITQALALKNQKAGRRTAGRTRTIVRALAGKPGAAGALGLRGPVGPAGIGSPGLQGLKGLKGPTGNVGPTGPTGATGPQGLPGAPGRDGLTAPSIMGAPGPSGPAGKDGPAGATGPPGKDGAAGKDGANGNPGPQGPQGDTGPPGPGQGATARCVPNKVPTTFTCTFQ